jgi:hypothetical protein
VSHHGTDPAPVEYLHAIQAGRYDGNDDWQPAHAVTFRITKKTPRRIYYVARDWGAGPGHVRYVDRQEIEAKGEIAPASRHWWQPDAHLYLAPPVVEQVTVPDLAALRAAMADAHPDRGGTDADFIAARARYERARATAGV